MDGPAIDANDDWAVVAWYTESKKPQVKAAILRKGNKSFSQPLIIDTNNVIGRFDIAVINRDEALIIWLAKSKKETYIMGCFINQHDLNSPTFKIVKTSDSRNSGFPDEINQKKFFMT